LPQTVRHHPLNKRSSHHPRLPQDHAKRNGVLIGAFGTLSGSLVVSWLAPRHLGRRLSAVTELREPISMITLGGA
ncbi:hypothetical protein, partial [Streptomyces sp. NPDC096324]|uniref:hypothetical protein n=1 Tax=Streptomyces sp. NPDC096324 TaxID=3366085 RepID=UPI0037F7FF7B